MSSHLGINESECIMNKKLISTLIALSLMVGIGYNVSATPLSDSDKAKMEQGQKDLNEVNGKIRELESKIDALTDKIEPINADVQKNNAEIEKTKEEIITVEKDIDKAKVEIEQKREVLGGRLRATYKTGGQANYLEVLLKSNGLSDFLSNMQAIGRIMSLDKNVINDLNSKKEQLDNEVENLQNKTKELDKLNEENKTKIAEFNKMVDEQKVIIEQRKEEKSKVIGQLAPVERQLISEFVNVINNSNSSITDLNNAITALRGIKNQLETDEIKKETVDAIEKAKEAVSAKEAAANASSSSSTSTNTVNRGDVAPPSGQSADALVSYACQFVGRPYIFGATGPDAFDCSGFTQYVFAKFGYGITRTTYTQVNQGTYVSRDQLAKGDLVFTRGSASAPGHVGIYVGNGQMVHASRPGVGVIVGPIYDYVTARRIL
ncbi:MAG: NlpC/P60 family protein [Sarcina sp.]